MMIPGRQKPLNPFRALLNSSRVTLAVVVVLGVVGPTGAQGAEDASGYDLGGPCLEDQPRRDALEDYVDLSRRIRRGVQREAWDTVIALQKRSVRLMCDNPYRWFTLAEYHRRAGEDTAALRLMTRLYERHPNAVEARLARGYELILAVRGSRPFQGSRLQAMMERNRASLRKRRAEFRDTLASLPASWKPPERYVARNACPFECCVYRTWSVHDSVTIYDRPKGDTVVGRVDEGDTVRGLTGHVYLKPRPVGLRGELYLGRDPRSMRERHADTGEILFELDYVGEGFSNVWYRGDTYLVSSHPFKAHCPRPGRECRGEYLHADDGAYTREWWVKVRLPDGTVGWTDEVEPFGRLDACA